MKFQLLLLLLFACFRAKIDATGPGVVKCDSRGGFPHILLNGRCFVWHNDRYVGLAQAAQECKDGSLGYYGKLAEPTTPNEMSTLSDFLFDNNHTSHFYAPFIGVKRVNTSSCSDPKVDGLVWAESGHDFDTANVGFWEPGEPDDCGSEAVVIRENKGQFADVNATSVRSFLCEFEEPANVVPPHNPPCCAHGTFDTAPLDSDKCLVVVGAQSDYQRARQSCMDGSLGFYGQLVMPLNNSRKLIIADLVKNTPSGAGKKFYIGLSRKPDDCHIETMMDNGWFWAKDDQPFDPKLLPGETAFFEPSPPSWGPTDCRKYYGGMFFNFPPITGREGLQLYRFMNHPSSQYLCAFDEATYPAACTTGPAQVVNGVCYKRFDDASFEQAVLNCKDPSFGGFVGEMAAPTTLAKYNDIKQAYIDVGSIFIPIYLGFYRSNTNCYASQLDFRWFWQNGLPFDFGAMSFTLPQGTCNDTVAVLEADTNTLHPFDPLESNDYVCEYVKGKYEPKENADYECSSAASVFVKVGGDVRAAQAHIVHSFQAQGLLKCASTCSALGLCCTSFSYHKPNGSCLIQDATLMGAGAQTEVGYLFYQR